MHLNFYLINQFIIYEKIRNSIFNKGIIIFFFNIIRLLYHKLIKSG